MQVKCSYCDGWINDYDEVCPNCGATNLSYKRCADNVPKTIEELKVWAKEHNLPLEQMRTYIGVDYHGPKSFGIYKDEKTGNFVVYKNKSDGTRAVRYEGSDEVYAVNELYMKMKERVAEQKAHMQPKSSVTSMGHTSSSTSYSNYTRKSRQQKSIGSVLKKLFVFLVVSQIAIYAFTLVVMLLASKIPSPNVGYYTYNSKPYYHSSYSWYVWNDDEWVKTYVPEELKDNYDEYYDSHSWNSESSYDSFYNSNAYTAELESRQAEESYYNDDDWDNDTDWDTDWDWDDSYDDWDSDW